MSQYPITKEAHNSNHELVDNLRIAAHSFNIAALLLSDTPKEQLLGRIGASVAILTGVELAAWVAKQLF